MDFSFLPIWGLAAWLVYAILFQIDFGNILLIRLIVERRFYLTRWRTFWPGDVIGLPVYGAFASFIVSQSHHPDDWWTQWYTHTAILLGAWGFQIWWQRQNYKSGAMSLEEIFCPSEIYHAFIFGVMFYMVASTFVPVAIVDRDPSWARIGALAGLSVWLVYFFLDIWKPRSIEKASVNRQAIWQMSWWPWKKQVQLG